MAHVREATESDIQQIASVTRASLDSTLARLGIEDRRYFCNALGTESTRRSMQEGCCYRVYEVDNALVGVIAVRVERHIERLLVIPSYQGKGVARALWEATKAACLRDDREASFTLSAVRDAVPKYEALGFFSCGLASEEHGLSRVPMRTVILRGPQ